MIRNNNNVLKRFLMFVGVCVIISISVLIISSRKRAITGMPSSPVRVASSNSMTLKQFEVEKGKLKIQLDNGDIAGAYGYLEQQWPTDKRLKDAFGSYIGRELYQKQGLRGVSVCSEKRSSAVFGCLHGLISLALTSVSPPSYSEVSNACDSIKDKTNRDICIHASGHVFTAIRGYKKDDIIAASRECNNLIGTAAPNQNDGYLCGFGVFMEYFFARYDREGLGIDKNLKRDSNPTFDPTSPYDICPLLSEKDKPFCYYQIGFWWGKVLKLPMQKIGSFCQALTSDQDRKSCYDGVGALVAQNIFDEKSMGKQFNTENYITEQCNNMPSKSGKEVCMDQAKKQEATQIP